MTGSDAALLLRDYVNTLDVECGIDELATPQALAAWLTTRGLLAVEGPTVDDDLVAVARALREGLRTAMLEHHGPHEPEFPNDLANALARMPLYVSLTGEGPALIPVAEGVRGGLSRIAAAIMTAEADGTWRRLKVCQEDTCRWAFLDTSKNRSRTWCSMQVCGNRTKTRNYRARQSQ